MNSNFSDIGAVFDGEKQFDQELGKLTSWKIGGKVACIAYPENYNQIIALKEYAENNKLPFYIIGKGSNILFGSGYFPGLIIYLGKNFNQYSLEVSAGGARINCNSGLSLSKLGIFAKEASLTGMEYLSFVPGTVGGAVITNAEAHGQSISDNIRKITILRDNKLVEYSKEMCKFSYRSSIFEKMSNFVILSVEFELLHDDIEQISIRMAEARKFRIDKQPKKPSAGSVFKNPGIGPAGKLIQDLGLKGVRRGDAMISDIHGNFITNENKASSEDVLFLIEMIQERIKKEYDIFLDLEIKLFNI